MITLYSLLLEYADRTKSATVHIKDFLDYVNEQAREKKYKNPELAKWDGNASKLFKQDIVSLKESKLCIDDPDSKDKVVFLPDYCREIIKSVYQNGYK